MTLGRVIFTIILIITMSVIFFSCRTIAGQPQLLRTSVSPEEIKPGDIVLIKAVVKDKHHIVRRVECTVKEDPRVRLKLNDDGIEPDEKANDGVWTLAVEVPENVPKGKFNLEITAYRKDGLPISVRTKKGEIRTLKESLLVEIK
ncbi:MAG: hypothetical protein N3G21_09955 [Candidatus Hydrogenedentes bacterium]|nr:hypothetical protein [Candidatus Hydrogenedentota bacterium]